MIKQENLMGLHISADGVSVVRGAQTGFAPLMMGVVQDSRVKSATLVAEAIRQARKDAHISATQCALCLSCGETIIRYFTFPDMAPALLRENVRGEIAGYLPMGAEQYVIDYRVVEEQTTEQGSVNLRVMVTAVQRQRVEEAVECAKAAGLRVKIVDVIENALGKLMRSVRPELRDYLAVQMTGDGVSILAYSAGQFFISRMLPNGMFDLYGTIAQEENTDAGLVQKNAEHADWNNAEDPLGRRVAFYLDEVVSEITRLSDYVNSRHAQSPLRAAYFFGDQATPRVVQYLRQKLPALPVRILAEELAQAAPQSTADMTGAFAALFREV
ncbi:MAG: pilus assembly protein PilM [Eubacteriales bacterium]|nr:pilus assembly protein PilM [Eubacteriales bacterium]